MSEKQESIIRAQCILLLDRNRDNSVKVKRIYERFLQCIADESLGFKDLNLS